MKWIEGEAPPKDMMVELKSIALSKLEVQLRKSYDWVELKQHLSNGNLEILKSLEVCFRSDNFMSSELDRYILEFFTYIFSEQLQDTTIKHEFKKPASWFQHLKEALEKKWFYPEWFRRKFPVKYDVQTKTARFIRNAVYPTVSAETHQAYIHEWIGEV